MTPGRAPHFQLLAWEVFEWNSNRQHERLFEFLHNREPAYFRGREVSRAKPITSGFHRAR